MAATVLVVEDERKLRDLVRSYLERAGFTVLSTDSGAEAITMALASALFSRHLVSCGSGGLAGSRPAGAPGGDRGGRWGREPDARRERSKRTQMTASPAMKTIHGASTIRSVPVIRVALQLLVRS